MKPYLTIAALTLLTAICVMCSYTYNKALETAYNKGLESGTRAALNGVANGLEREYPDCSEKVVRAMKALNIKREK